MRWYSHTILTIAVSVAVSAIRTSYVAADAPILIDEDRIDSANRLFFAIPGPDEKTTRVFRRSKAGPSMQLWSMPTWSVMGYLSDDGNYLVRVYPGVNILALDYKPDDVMVSIRRRGELVRDVHLKDLIRDLRALGRRSESGYPWGEYQGFVEPHRFALSTVEHRTIVFDVETGREVSNLPTADAADPRPRRRR